VNLPELLEKCLLLQKRINLASFLWMKLMPLEEEDSVKVFVNNKGTSADREI